MTPDVIVSWPHSCDYPLWRRFIRAERDRFARVLVCFTANTMGPTDYRRFVAGQIGDIAECFDSPPLDGRDWRDVAVNAALDRSDAEWVWFTEQDFLIKDPERYWHRVDQMASYAEAIGIWDQVGRHHPASLFVRRAVIDETPRYFGPVPNDHFVAFSQAIWGRVSEYGRRDDFEHLQGLSQNHYLIDTGQSEGIFARGRFRAYLAECLAAGVPLDPRWAERAQRETGLVTA